MTTQRLLIAGLDGAIWNVLDPLLAAGRLPTLARLIEQGVKATLQSVWPPISAAAWVSMMTGLNPGQHGIFDFRNLDLATYTGHDETLVTSHSYHAPTLFDYLTQAGRRSIAYGVPLTYPPRPINGAMVAGYPTPDHRRAYTYPAEVAGRLGPLYAISPDEVGAADPVRQADIYRRAMRAMTDNLIMLAQEPWDVLMFVNGATDGAQHRFFKFVTPGFPGVADADRQRYGRLLDDVMIAADAELGCLLDHLPQPLNVLVLSDHGGMARPRQAFNANAWLAEHGWLIARDGPAAAGRRFSQQAVEWAKQRLPLTEWAKQRLPTAVKRRLASLRSGAGNIDWPRTQAYRVKLSHPIEGIHLNVSGRQPEGFVLPEQYDPLREAIITKLGQQPEIVAVHPREAIFSGPYLDRAPDIIYQLRPEYDGGALLDHVVSEVPPGWLKAISGYHALNGILVAAGPAFARGTLQDARLLDVTPTVLHLLLDEVPAGLDGRVLEEIFARPRPIRYGPAFTSAAHRPPAELTPEEISGITAALRDLGYL